MSFSVQDFRSLIEMLYQHPEWRAELRSLVLSEELLSLPQVVRELAESHRRAEERLTRLEQAVAKLEQAVGNLEQTVAELAEAQKRAEERLSRLEHRVANLEQRLEKLEHTVAKLAEAQQQAEERLSRLEHTVAKLAEAQQQAEERLTRLEQAVARLEQTVAELAEAQKRTEYQVQRLTDRVGKLSGTMLEMQYRSRASSYFGKILLNTRVVDVAELTSLLGEHLDEDQFDELLLLDLILHGRLRLPVREGQPRPEAWLAVEISVVVDREDVERALRRAALLRQAGLRALPVAAGESTTEGAQELAQEKGVILQLDGRPRFLDQALEMWGKP
ncbi:MAG: hypothetical protein NZ840_05665 [Anaerolineales bacterium]|nr:hypothetical protein [Anaerolineales bacterium]MDW8161525.1 hypothetical protein [Anaerolineales bacterium]